MMVKKWLLVIAALGCTAPALPRKHGVAQQQQQLCRYYGVVPEPVIHCPGALQSEFSFISFDNFIENNYVYLKKGYGVLKVLLRRRKPVRIMD
jgi:hypothetical protein